MVKHIAATTKKINSAHILRLGRPWCETNHDLLRLAEYRFIYEKINTNRIAPKCRFWCSKFKKILEASSHKMSRVVQYTRTESDRLRYAPTRLAGTPMARDLGHLPFVRTDWSVLFIRKWYASVLRTVRTGSGQTTPSQGVGPISSHVPARVHRQKRRNFLRQVERAALVLAVKRKDSNMEESDNDKFGR